MAPAAALRRGDDGAAVLRQGFAKHYGGGGCVGEGEGGTKGLALEVLHLPTIYRRAKGGAGPRRSNLLGGAAKGRNPSSPRHLGGAFPS